MTPASLSEIAKATGGQLSGKDVPVTGYSTDTRSIKSGDVYFCLRGDRFDGHDFIQAAVDKGAVAVVAECSATNDSVAWLQVDDSRFAYGVFAGLWRSRYKNPVVGVTGSNGKTTVKQLLASIFAQAGDVHFTRANDNNEVGVPQTLLGLENQHDFAVVEMGASALGEIHRLSEFVRPDVAVITNAGAAHLEGFGNAQSVADEKAWVYRNLADNGTAVINADDNFKDFWMGLCSDKNILTFGVRGDVCVTRKDPMTITIQHAGQKTDCGYQLAGEHNVANAAAAAACAIAAGVSLDHIASGLSAATPVAGRLNFIKLASGITLIDDTYNANPASTRAAIDVLGEFEGERYMVLGDLLELGEEEVDQHRAVGVYAHANRVDRLFATGELCRHTVDAFGEGARWFAEKQHIVDSLCKELPADSAVLVKGSRSMKMEVVVAGVSDQLAASAAGACC